MRNRSVRPSLTRGVRWGSGSRGGGGRTHHKDTKDTKTGYIGQLDRLGMSLCFASDRMKRNQDEQDGLFSILSSSPSARRCYRQSVASRSARALSISAKG